MKWICCQIGAREHYSIPRALQRRGVLDELITDVWAKPGSFISLGNRSLRNRFHDGVMTAKVRAANLGSVVFEVQSRARGCDGWKLITERNNWFQRFAVSQLTRRGDLREPVTVFAYSYAARLIFKFAREHGWRTILGQMDPGPAQEQIVKRAYSAANGNGANDFPPPPRDYWDQWRSEVALADHIVVNSDWSRHALLTEGVPHEKVKIIPLAFEKPQEAIGFERNYPNRFTAERPLRVLFLGQVNLGKGIGALFDAIRLTKNTAIQFWFVGPVQVSIPTYIKTDDRVQWFQTVPRDQVSKYYRDADVFIFPTISDGFGLTQLEAQSWKLPVVASPYCGSVVKDGVTGLILKEVSGQAIAEALLSVHRSPASLQQMSVQCEVSDQFSLNSLASALVAI